MMFTDHQNNVLGGSKLLRLYEFHGQKFVDSTVDLEIFART